MNIRKVVWSTASIALLAVTLGSYDQNLGRDADLLMLYGMLTLSFPAGFLVAGFFAFAAYLEDVFRIPLINSYYGPIMISLIWLCFFVIGYLQWFKLVPYFIRKFRTRNHGRLS